MDDANFTAVCNAFALNPNPVAARGPLWVAEGVMRRLSPLGEDYPVAVVRAGEADALAAYRDQVLLIARAQTPAMQAVLDECRATADRLGAAMIALASG